MLLLASEHATSEPWWGTALIAGAFTVLGGIITLIIQWVVDRKTRQIEDKRRWEVEIRDSCVTIGESVKAIDDAWTAIMFSADSDAVKANQSLLEPRRREITTEVSRMKLIASKDLIGHLTVVQAKALEAEQSIGNRVSEDLDPAEANVRAQLAEELGASPHRDPFTVVSELRTAQAALEEAARKQLRIR